MNRNWLCAAAAALALGQPARAAQLEVPLGIESGVVAHAAAAHLGLDRSGRALLARDDCNTVELRDLDISPASTGLVASLAVQAEAGMVPFGRCLGLGSWSGRLVVDLAPGLAADGRAIDFHPRRVELRRPDGSPGLLTAPARLLAEQLVLPRLEAVSIDLRDSLGGIELLIAGLRSPKAAGERPPGVKLARLETTSRGLQAVLVLEVAPVPVATPVPVPALGGEELAQWQRVEDELDGFLTAVIANLASRAEDADLRIELLGVLLDSRLAIARALSGRDGKGSPDPVRELFVEAWERLRPHAAQLARGMPAEEAALELAAFIAGADAIHALDTLGPEFGLEISRDGLRRLARILLAEEAPAAFTPLSLKVDHRLRGLFRLEPAGPGPVDSPTGHADLWNWLVPAARAAGPGPAEALRTMTPSIAGLDEYLETVAALLEAETRRHLDNDSRFPEEYRAMIDPLIRATAWKETCWRHYLDNANPPSVIRSEVGAVGMMQINVRVWRGLYDMHRLESDVAYNVAAGIAILEHYFVDYAMRRGEHQQPGGAENLPRATYAAYNGGPGQMARYRKDSTPGRLRAIDEAFWRHYEQMEKESWPDVSSCYPV